MEGLPGSIRRRAGGVRGGASGAAKTWITALIVLTAMLAGCGSTTANPANSCVAGSASGVVVTVRGPTPRDSCSLIEHVGRIAGWTGQPTLPAERDVSEACVATDSRGNSVTVQTTAPDPSTPVSIISDALSANGYQLRSPIKWGSGC